MWEQDLDNNRPSSIQVDLLQRDVQGNTILYDQQILNAENHWSYTWNVVETTVPRGYTVSSNSEGNTVVLTNTAKTPVTVEQQKPSNQIPLTGQLLWPVPVLLIIGITFLVIGKACKKYEE